MTGADLRRARKARAERIRRLKNLEQTKETERTRASRLYHKRRSTLERCFGVKSTGALFELWRRGEIQIVKNGALVDYDRG